MRYECNIGKSIPSIIENLLLSTVNWISVGWDIFQNLVIRGVSNSLRKMGNANYNSESGLELETGTERSTGLTD